MSSFYNLLVTRRSIRKFTSQKVEADTIIKIMKAALMAPSSRNTKPCEFIVVQDYDTILSLSESRIHGSQFIASAPLVVVVAANENLSDVWFEDCSIASTFIQLHAHNLGLGSCWVQVYKRMKSEGLESELYVRELLKIPANFRVLNMIAIGHADEKKNAIDVSKLQTEKIHQEHF
jgi:nitroreductase